MPHLVLADAVFRDLNRLYDFLEPKNQRAAKAAIRSIRSSFPLLLRSPEIGYLVDEQLGIREWTVQFGRGAYRVAYQANDVEIRVLSVRHSREDA